MYCQIDPGHLVAIEFDDGFGHLDFCHGRSGLFGNSALRAGRDAELPGRYSIRKRGLEGEMAVQLGSICGHLEMALQPALNRCTRK